MERLPPNRDKRTISAPWWVLMSLTLTAVLFGLVAASALFLCAMLILGGEFDHGGAQVLLIGVTCTSVAGALAWVCLRWSNGA